MNMKRLLFDFINIAKYLIAKANKCIDEFLDSTVCCSLISKTLENHLQCVPIGMVSNKTSGNRKKSSK